MRLGRGGKVHRSPLEVLQLGWKDCTRCPLGETAHHHVLWECPFDTAHILLVGEGPGEAEDAIGRPFVGPAGKVLKKAMEEAFKGREVKWALTNLVACRPRTEGGKNRAPDEPEIKACRPRLLALIEHWKPRVIVALGKVPHEWMPLVPGTHLSLRHPSFVLRSGSPHEYDHLVAGLRKARRIAYEEINPEEELLKRELASLPEDAWRRTSPLSQSGGRRQ